METIARSQGFVTQSLLTKAATATGVLAVVEKAAKELVEDDFFFLTYSGHGGQINDANKDEPDGLEETWVLYDRELLDDELYAAWSLFRPDVRIFVVSDSCHSGTITKEMFLNPTTFLSRLEARVRATAGPNLRPKFLPPEVQSKVYKERASLYDDIRKKAPRRERVNVECSVILISACQDNQIAMEGNKNELFTETLLRVWKKYTIMGHRERAFEHQRPFMITLPRSAAAA